MESEIRDSLSASVYQSFCKWYAGCLETDVGLIFLNILRRQFKSISAPKKKLIDFIKSIGTNRSAHYALDSMALVIHLLYNYPVGPHGKRFKRKRVARVSTVRKLSSTLRRNTENPGLELNYDNYFATHSNEEIEHYLKNDAVWKGTICSGTKDGVDRPIWVTDTAEFHRGYNSVSKKQQALWAKHRLGLAHYNISMETLIELVFEVDESKNLHQPTIFEAKDGLFWFPLRCKEGWGKTYCTHGFRPALPEAICKPQPAADKVDVRVLGAIDFSSIVLE